MRMAYQVKVYTTGDELPQLPHANFFHSPELYHIISRTSGQKPFMAVATDERGCVVGHLLAIVRGRISLFPPFYYVQGRIYGEGEYAAGAPVEDVFRPLITAVTQRLRKRLCFITELSNLSRKMFGYNALRENHYFPIGWQEVHESLHSKSPEERITPRALEHINHAYSRGVETRQAASEDEVRELYRMLHKVYRFRPQRFPPTEELMVQLFHSESARIFVTLYKGKVIGGCTCIYSSETAYLWHVAARRKRYPHLHPELITIWQALQWAHQHGYAHLIFLDAGLPLPHNPYRDFILRFGGKPVATYRWYRVSVAWINKVIEWICRE